MPNPEQPSDLLGIACELVGRYQYHFSRIEDAMNEGIAKVFDLNHGASSVLLANMDFVKKVNIIRVMSSLQFTDDGSLEKLVGDIAGINNPDRQTVIHSTFEPHGSGAVKFKRTTTTHAKLVIKEMIWTRDDFAKRFATMERLAAELRMVIANLKPYVPSLDFSDPRNSQYVSLLML